MAIYEIETNRGFERGNVRTLHPGMRNSINTYAQKKCRLPLMVFRPGVKGLPREREVPKILGRAIIFRNAKKCLTNSIEYDKYNIEN